MCVFALVVEVLQGREPNAADSKSSLPCSGCSGATTRGCITVKSHVVVSLGRVRFCRIIATGELCLRIEVAGGGPAMKSGAEKAFRVCIKAHCPVAVVDIAAAEGVVEMEVESAGCWVLRDCIGAAKEKDIERLQKGRCNPDHLRESSQVP